MIIKASETLKDAILTVNSVSINYPVTNIFDSALKTLFKTDSNTTALIVFDAGAPITVDSISIAKHNISSGVTTLKFQGNASDSWGTPSVDETLTWNSGIINKDFSGGSYRYWRLNIVDAANPDGLISLGRVYGSDSYTTPGLAQAFSNTVEDHSEETITANGTTYADLRYFNELFSVRWDKITTAEKALMKAQFLLMTEPHFVTFDESSIDIDTMYVNKDGASMAFEQLRNSAYWKTSMSYREEI